MRLIRNLFVLVLVAVLASGCSQYLSKKPDFTIVPGQRMGPISIGMDFNAAKRIVNGYGAARDSEQGTGYYNEQDGVGAGIYWRFDVGSASGATPGRVRAVITDDARFRTEDGVGPKSDAKQAYDSLIKRYGKPTLAMPIDSGVIYVEWASAGIGLIIEMSGVGGGTIYSVVIFAPTQQQVPQAPSQQGTI